MATAAPATNLAHGFRADQGFFTRFALLLSLLIVFGFVQARLLGHAPPGAIPPLLHLHGGLMVAWLGMFVLQNSLISAGNVALHRQTGWAALAIAAAATVTGAYTGIVAIASGRLPPFFAAPYFLAVTQLGVLAFAALVAFAMVKRRDVQWHRRLMLGSVILLSEPAIGRIVPMPLTGQHLGELIILGLQLALIGILARHDVKLFGKVHPATLVIALAALAYHLAVELLARLPAWQSLAAGIAAG